MTGQQKPHFEHVKPWEPEKIAIVIPCYNEAQRLSLDAFIEFVKPTTGIRLIFVDDGSKDQTISLLCGVAAALPEKVDAVMMKKNGGKAEAVRQGLQFAVSRGHKYVAFLDADLATPIDAIVDFASVADRMPEIDVVFGSRKGGLGHRVYREFHRKIISRVCATLGRMATGLPIHDTQCGAKLFRNTPALKRSLDAPFTAGWLFDVELFLRISNPNRRERNNFFEYPVIEWTEIPGSKIRSADIIKSGVKMLGLIARQWYIRKKYSKDLTLNTEKKWQNLKAGNHLSYKSLAGLTDCIDQKPDGVKLDLSSTKTLEPSIFTALMQSCDALYSQGKQVKIILPDNEPIVEAARNTGLVAIANCVRSIAIPENIAANNHFDLVEV